MIPTFFLVILFIYGLLYFFDKFYKTCAHYPYIQFLKNTGFEIKFLQIKWETTAFNRLLLRWGSSHSSFLSTWFSIGLNVTLIFLPISCVLLLVSLYQMFFVQNENPLESSIIVPIIPGATLAISDLPYYVVSLVISSVFHEFGHALTAVKEDVHLINVGFTCIFILPIAYVGLNTEDILKLTPIKSLRIYCAGVWHNISLSIFFYLIFLMLPYIFSPFYEVNNGVIVTDLSPNSPLIGENNGLNVGNQIFKINNCKINNFQDWINCINMYRNLNLGFCTPSEVISNHDETVFKHSSTNDFDCCNDQPGALCFEYLEATNGILEIPPHTCLPVRVVVSHSNNYCNSSNDCVIIENTHCLKPMLKDHSRVLVIKRKSEEKPIVYLGLAEDLLLTVRVSEYIPKYVYLSLNFPNSVEKIFKYIVVISLGLGIVNVLPSLWMDGHYISNALIKILLGNRIKNEKIYLGVTLLVPFFGTLLFSSLVLHTLWVFVFK
nr:membrane-bound transcription factor site-2 protease [Onthophagus taurus]